MVPHTLILFKTNIADFPTLFKTEFRFLIPCLRHLRQGEIKGDLLLFFGGGAVRILVESHKTQRAIPPATQAKAAQAVILFLYIFIIVQLSSVSST